MWENLYMLKQIIAAVFILALAETVRRIRSYWNSRFMI